MRAFVNKESWFIYIVNPSNYYQSLVQYITHFPSHWETLLISYNQFITLCRLLYNIDNSRYPWPRLQLSISWICWYTFSSINAVSTQCTLADLLFVWSCICMLLNPGLPWPCWLLIMHQINCNKITATPDLPINAALQMNRSPLPRYFLCSSSQIYLQNILAPYSNLAFTTSNHDH